ncbi:MAG TPA: hypothetical protein VK563_05545 [Puia sp.]|nr:hypothetical protein [Puia sp.]
MRKNSILFLLSLFSCCALAAAQTVNKDSLSLVSRINADKEKLVELQSSLDEKVSNKQKAAEQAQNSADENRKAANKLNNDPEDRKLARRADQKAGDARDDAKKARKADRQLEDLRKDIRNLTEKIAKEKTKLIKYTGTAQDSAQ